MRDFEGRENELVLALELMEEQQSSQTDETESMRLQSSSKTLTQQTMNQSYLKQAIERGDWNAVAQAAAITCNELSSAPINRADFTASSIASSSSYYSHQTLYLVKEDRIKHLDDLIAQGDWIGIIILAGQYQAMDEDILAPLRENENAIENQHPHERSGITNKQGVDTIESTAELVESSLQSELSAAEAITAKNLVVSNSLSISTEKVEDKNAIRKKIERLILRIVPNELSECDRRYLLSHLTFLNSF